MSADLSSSRVRLYSVHCLPPAARARALGRLSPRERQLLALVCCDRMPLLAAARKLDLSYQEAAQLCVDALLRVAQTAREEAPAGPASPL